jgi:hypothetical protein
LALHADLEILEPPSRSPFSPPIAQVFGLSGEVKVMGFTLPFAEKILIAVIDKKQRKDDGAGVQAHVQSLEEVWSS